MCISCSGLRGQIQRVQLLLSSSWQPKGSPIGADLRLNGPNYLVVFSKSGGHSRVRQSMLLLGYMFCRSLTGIRNREAEVCNHIGRLHKGLYARAITMGQGGGVLPVNSHHVTVFVRCTVYPSMTNL